MNLKLKTISLTLAAALFATSAQCEEIRVAVVDTFKAPMQEIIALFEKDSGDKVNVSYNTSGNLYQEMKTRSVYQAFFTADGRTPGRLANVGQAIKSTEFTYAIPKIAVWSPKAGFVKDDKAFLLSADVAKLAIARKNGNQIGDASFQALKKLGILKDVEPKLDLVDRFTKL